MRRTTIEYQHDIFFTGLIHPQSGSWHIDHPVTLVEDGRTIDVYFRNSVLNVRIVFSDGHELGRDAARDETWLNPIWYEVEATVQAVLDSLGFVLAASLDIEMTTGRADRAAILGGLTSLPDFARVQGDRVESDLLGKYLHAAAGNANVRHALADMRLALRLTNDTAFYCYRAVECIRQEFIHPEDNKPSHSWVRLHVALGTSQAEMDPLTQLATPRRHGEAVRLTHTERLAWLRWTRAVIGRYVEDHLAAPPTTGIGRA